WEGWAILLRQKQKKLIMLPSETMIWQPEFTDKTLSRKPGAVQIEFIQELICMQDSSLENFRSRSTLNKKGRTSATFHLLNLFSLT
ncbi:hypothetical protein MMR86_25165, partial [Escherichia coli]|nr:hypothetical protein [Escherichia coli]MCM4913748.1 hypothetical protein [Escherichia coli]